MKRGIRYCFEVAEGALDGWFPPRANPLHALGALGFFMLWVVSVSGAYIFIFFDTGTTEAFLSVESLTHDQWYLGGVMRSLHRYASDAMVLLAAIHMVREYAYDRYRGPRWFTWVTGVSLIWLLFAAGITGYWMVWDKLAQYVALATTELLDVLPIFGEPLSRNFLAASHLSDRFFTLLTFLHIAVPLILLFVLWIHLQRVAHAYITPTRPLIYGAFAMLLAMSLVSPVVSQGPANLAEVASPIALDWYYLWPYPVADIAGPGLLWTGALLASLALCVMPWLPPLKLARPAIVNLDNCNGCTRCADDCPFAAISMVNRTDGKPFTSQAAVDPDACMRCGLCMAACPTASPFRRMEGAAPGIEVPSWSMESLKKSLHAATSPPNAAPPILVFACDSHRMARDLAPQGTVVTVPCVGMVPPSVIDYALTRESYGGVLLYGCGEGQCSYRLGGKWTEDRVAGRRDPKLRARIDRQRVRFVAAGAAGTSDVGILLDEFRARLSAAEGAPGGPAS